MVSINIFAENGNSASIEAAYNWPNQPLPTGRLIGKQGNALLLELANGNGVAVISAPLSELQFQHGGLPEVNLDWAFA